MKTDAKRLFAEYQENVLAAFEQQRMGNEVGYAHLLDLALKVRQRAQKRLSHRDFRVFAACSERTVDVLKKCCALGLHNLEKRLQEFQLAETLTQLVAERSLTRRQLLQDQAVISVRSVNCGHIISAAA